MAASSPMRPQGRAPVASLRAHPACLAMERRAQLAAPISEVQGSARILVFEYEREAEAAAEAANVRTDGQPSRTSLITWVSTPRFYRQGRLIFLYIGRDARILAARQSVAGSPFVVGSTACTLSGRRSVHNAPYVPHNLVRACRSRSGRRYPARNGS